MTNEEIVNLAETDPAVFPGGARRASHETFYSEVDQAFISEVSTQPYSTTACRWQAILYDLCQLAQNPKCECSELASIVQRMKWILDFSDLEVRIKIADTLTAGSETHGKDNWKKRREDGTPSIPISNWLNHAIKHVLNSRKGATDEDHIAHALCNLYMAWWLLHTEPETPMAKDQPAVTLPGWACRNSTEVHTVIHDVDTNVQCYTFLDFDTAVKKANELVSMEDSDCAFDEDGGIWQSMDGMTRIFLANSSLNTTDWNKVVE